MRPLLIWNCQLQQPKTPGCICVPCIERNCVICVSTIVIKNYDWNMCIFLWDICTFLSLQWKTGDVCFKPCKDYVWLIKHIVCMISSLKWCTVFNYIYIYIWWINLIYCILSHWIYLCKVCCLNEYTKWYNNMIYEYSSLWGFWPLMEWWNHINFFQSSKYILLIEGTCFSYLRS